MRCYFCDASGVRVVGQSDTFYAKCPDCQATGPVAHTAEDATSAWEGPQGTGNDRLVRALRRITELEYAVKQVAHVADSAVVLAEKRL